MLQDIAQTSGMENSCSLSQLLEVSKSSQSKGEGRRSRHSRKKSSHYGVSSQVSQKENLENQSREKRLSFIPLDISRKSVAVSNLMIQENNKSSSRFSLPTEHQLSPYKPLYLRDEDQPIDLLNHNECPQDLLDQLKSPATAQKEYLQNLLEIDRSLSQEEEEMQAKQMKLSKDEESLYYQTFLQEA